MLHALELCGVCWAESQEVPGFPSWWYTLGLRQHGMSLRTQILVLWDGAREPEIWRSAAFSLSLACSWLPSPHEACKG